MKYDKIDTEMFVENRRRFAKKMKQDSLAVLNSNDVMPTNADGIMGFRQNNDLFYLSGIDQEESILLISPQAQDSNLREVLFITETNEHIRIWEGDKLTKEQAREISGIKNVQWLQEFESILHLMAFHADTIYLGHNEHIKTSTKEIQTREDRFIDWCKARFPLHEYGRVARITRDLRIVKSEEEINQIKKACEITGMGFERALGMIQPGVHEFEIEAELTYTFLKNRSRGHAFLPIIGSGGNACALHYVKNEDHCEDGQMILMDFGAEYANYYADITRCVPVNGTYSPRQRAVYEAVLRCLREGVKMLRPGVRLDDYEKNMASLVEKELIGLGLLDAEEVANQDPDAPLYKKYFMHGTAHHIGLDVHDVGNRMIPVREGMVLTCEPGIYIREENIGVRLENDYLVTADGPVSLTDHIPIEPDEIEDIMAKNAIPV
ncbi:Xaa-Pro aminopeptidase [Fulvitalea axinellae]|uniref:Xaa-Pro aminopeptidase n=1 Tax=Fulvitalea axinellae TaxID=1182444 RepID=A0AAU9D2U5_9BACT|nr:Xaa-Pro aminopeptidase [Fulvitalea axinellae]